MFDHDNVYVLQNDDRRMIYAIPFHRDFTLIGLSERGFEGDPATAAPGADDLAYLCTAASRYFRERIAIGGRCARGGRLHCRRSA
jgi:glycerol-3-phosphate dehydrogenase